MPPDEPPSDAELSFRELTRETYLEILRLELAEGQNRFVATNAWSVAQAHFHEEAWFRGIYAGDTPIGFFMLERWPETKEYGLWRFMIDRRYQRRGFGRRALEKILALVLELPEAQELLLSHAVGDGHPGGFYERMGFEYTGEIDHGERVMRFDLGAG